MSISSLEVCERSQRGRGTDFESLEALNRRNGVFLLGNKMDFWATTKTMPTSCLWRSG